MNAYSFFPVPGLNFAPSPYTNTKQTFPFLFLSSSNFASFYVYDIFLRKYIDPFIGTRSDAFKATLQGSAPRMPLEHFESKLL